jgi:L-fuculose-phosphate aldolase
MVEDERTIREAIVAQCRWMNASGLNQGTSGNISVRFGDAMLITPSAVSYENLDPGMIVRMSLAAEDGRYDHPLRPSTEWRFHRDILRARPEVGAVVHTHSLYATVLSMLRREIPACHYMLAAFGGSTIRCADYATFGTAELSRNALTALEGRKGCLLANHGMIVAGEDLARAMWLAIELETLARQYVIAVQTGTPLILDDAEIERVRAAFAGYGLQPAPHHPEG